MSTASCNSCKFAIFEDYGYSNYTVEGTEFFCAKKLNPNGNFDRFYGKAKELEHGSICSGYVEGETIKIDVDHEALSELTDEQNAIYKMKNE
jgi:hypothetical protein